MPTRCDVAVIGAGQAAIPLAAALAGAGRKVVLAEREQVGGSCVNYGCTPTKAAIASARVAHLARRAGEYGVSIDSVRVDFAQVIGRARRIVGDSRASLEKWIASTAALDLMRGHARLEGREGGMFRLRVGAQEVRSREVVLDTGTRSQVPAIEGIDDVGFLTAETWLEKPTLPGHLLIVGGGYIGLEMGQFYRRMGSEVTIVSSGPRIAGREDADVADALRGILEHEGIRFVLDGKVRRVQRRAGGIDALIEGPDGPFGLEISDVFIAAGRRPNTDDLGLETVGLVTSDKGTIDVDQRLRTGIEGLWAAGDIRGGPMFTHTSWDDYRILESQMVGDRSRTLDRVVPYALFTDPELGRVGLTEAQAREQGRDIRVGRFEMRNNGKARELGETAGFIKVVVDRRTGLLLGASVLCVEAGELVHAYVQLMNARAPFTVMQNAIHIHPTLSEAVQSAVAALADGA